MSTTEKHGIKLDYMDPSADPGKDFNRYANGHYLDTVVIPPEYPRWGAFLMLREKSLNRQHDLLDALLKQKYASGTNEQKLRDFYRAAMNERQIEAKGHQPLAKEIARINRVRTMRGLADELAHLHNFGAGTFFAFGSSPDFDNSNQVVAHALQGGLGLPDRDYYIEDNEDMANKRAKYLEHVTKMFQLVGEKPAVAKRHAQAVLSIETELAKASMSQADQRNPENIKHKMTVSEFAALTPRLPLTRYLSTLGAPQFDTLNVHQPEFFKALDRVISQTKMKDIKAYLRWGLIHAAADHLSSAFVNENFDFFGRILQGSKELKPRWKRMVDLTDRVLGEALGQLYVAKYFPPEAKARMLELVNNLIAALKDTLTEIDWMSQETRQNALVKLSTFVPKIGYPDKWEDYSDLSIRPGSHFDNVLRASLRASKRDLAKIGKAVDRDEWGMTPPTVNAYYSPQMNQIVFPAGILQAPFFDMEADDATNYGGIAVVIGHEMTHGFDDSGARFDAAGNVKMWWTEQDFENFSQRVGQIITQFGRFTSQTGKKLDGKLVVGEAASDLGGVKLALRALNKVLGEKGRSTIDGFTDEQRFFISFAQIWASVNTPEYEDYRVKSDPHPMERYRVNGTLAHVPEFPKAFGLPDDCPMMLPQSERCHLW